MTTLLKISLHLDAFNMAQGGGFAWYDSAGRLVASEAFPAFVDGELTEVEAAELLVTLAVERRQMTLF
jgi:hypothetical protein